MKSITAALYRCFLSLAFPMVILGVAVSRMYLGSHFLGQVILGAVCGVTTGFVVTHLNLEFRFSRHIHQRSQKSLGNWTDQSQSLLKRCFCCQLYELQLLNTVISAGSFVLLVPWVEFCLLSFFCDPMHSLVLVMTTSSWFFIGSYLVLFAFPLGSRRLRSYKRFNRCSTGYTNALSKWKK